MPVGMDIGLGPGDLCLMGTQLPQKNGTPFHSIFGPCVLWPNGWMDEEKTPLGTEVDLGPGHIVLDGVPALRERSTAAAPSFRPMSCGYGSPSQLLLSSCLI